MSRLALLPIVALLAWIYDLTEHGISLQQDTAVAEPFGGRKMDFFVIGLLAVALTFSVYLNLRASPGNTDASDPISVLIADFVNGTGDTIFDGLLEPALGIGIEGAPNVMSYDRRAAETLAGQLQADGDDLSASVARLVAVREGIDIVLSGTIEPDGEGYRLALRGLDPLSGDIRFDLSGRAQNRQAVLGAIASLSQAVRDELGDTTLERDGTATAERFTAASIEAASAYAKAVVLSFEGRENEGLAYFRTATELDPNFGRAYAGWAASEFRLGRTERATALWQKATSLMGTMTERERLRTLGNYYIGVTRNFEQAVDTFSELIEKYPADAAARNNLAVAAFLSLDFKTASEQGGQVLTMFPKSELYRSNFALYAMYSGNFAEADATATALIEADPSCAPREGTLS